MGQRAQITVCRSEQELLGIRERWQACLTPGRYTVFQEFGLNLLAARIFAEREEPYVICAQAPDGVAIIPAVLRTGDGSIRLLGEELFDYRSFLHHGDSEVLLTALRELAALGRPMEVVALPESEAAPLRLDLNLTLFCRAPAVTRADCTSERFAAAHPRLARNLRRLERQGFMLCHHRGDYAGLVRFIYEQKAAQDAQSLFLDPLRVEFMVQAAKLLPDAFEIFTLEDEGSIAAALVTLRDQNCRRFYTGWFAPELEKHSPALSLIYEVTRLSLGDGLDCDYMTGEQPYKKRLATSSIQLYRVTATAADLAAITVPAASTAA